MKRLFGILLALASCASFAAGGSGPATRVEASMVVTGSIVVNPDGTVSNYTLDKQDQLPSAVVEVIGKTVPTWKFQPILVLDSSNRPERAKAAMSLRVVASPMPNGDYSVGVKGVSFGEENPQSQEDISWKRYDVSFDVYREDMQEDLSGTVYLLVEVNRAGRVANIGVQQVNLRTIAGEAQMEAWRRRLGRLAMKAAHEWEFNFPQVGNEAAANYLLIRVPVDFDPNGKPTNYGDWDAYVPGPVNQISWADSNLGEAGTSVDSIPSDGMAFQDDRRFVLLNNGSD